MLTHLIYYCLRSYFLGPVFGSKDFFRGLAIFFDTYANQNGEHAVSFLIKFYLYL